MYWAALSTDIKKSSVNWSALPKWMQKAVQYHNKIIETVVDTTKIKYNKIGVECKLLPNSPEGDAFTYVFSHTDMNELKEFVILLGTDLQTVLHKLRNCNEGEGKNDDNAKLQCKIILKGGELKKQLEKEYPLDKGSKMNSKKNEEIKEKRKKLQQELETHEYYGGIFIRVGIAFSEEAPIPYTFKRYRGKNVYSGKVSTSYRSGVVCSSEKAEEKADYEMVSRLQGKDIKEQSVIKECYIENGERKFKDRFERDGNKIQEDNVKNETKTNKTAEFNREGSLRRHSVPSIDNKKLDLSMVPKKRQDKILENAKKALEQDITNKVEAIRGFCVFVEYQRTLKDKLMIENPHLKTFIEQEYIDVHEKANRVVEDFLNKKTAVFRGGLVKQKRDSTSMFVIIANYDKQTRTLSAPATELYKQFSKLVSSLPYGSCVGFAYGEMKEITMDRPGGEGTFTDYFEASVNLAARMAMRDWSYSTKWGIVGENGHHNRVAFTSKKKSNDTTLIEGVVKDLEVSNVPFTYDHVPLSALNAGGDDIIGCVSTRFVGWERLRVGDLVTKDGDEEVYEIEKDFGDFFELDDKKNLISRERLKKVKLKL
tara:strand:+ start:2411 stop:4198 length:1788 start_codon:yes stop_codon:yes gene_type:complete